MSKTNTLTSHHPERTSIPIDKMNSPSKFKSKSSSTNKMIKKLASSKRRNLLRHSIEDKF